MVEFWEETFIFDPEATSRPAQMQTFMRKHRYDFSLSIAREPDGSIRFIPNAPVRESGTWGNTLFLRSPALFEKALLFSMNLVRLD
jgi:hypothetical protein